MDPERTFKKSFEIAIYIFEDNERVHQSLVIIRHH